jgi:hypothetical protein
MPVHARTSGQRRTRSLMLTRFCTDCQEAPGPTSDGGSSQELCGSERRKVWCWGRRIGVFVPGSPRRPQSPGSAWTHLAEPAGQLGTVVSETRRRGLDTHRMESVCALYVVCVFEPAWGKRETA